MGRWARATIGFLVAGASGFAVSLAIGTVYVAIANGLAEDGPYFPAPFVALFFVALPLTVAFLPFQLIALGYVVLRGRLPLLQTLLLGGVCGAIAGLFLGLVLFSAESTGILIASAMGMAHGMAALGCYSLFFTLTSLGGLDRSEYETEV